MAWTNRSNTNAGYIHGNQGSQGNPHGQLPVVLFNATNQGQPYAPGTSPNLHLGQCAPAGSHMAGQLGPAIAQPSPYQAGAQAVAHNQWRAGFSPQPPRPTVQVHPIHAYAASSPPGYQASQPISIPTIPGYPGTRGHTTNAQGFTVAPAPTWLNGIQPSSAGKCYPGPQGVAQGGRQMVWYQDSQSEFQLSVTEDPSSPWFDLTPPDPPKRTTWTDFPPPDPP